MAQGGAAVGHVDGRAVFAVGGLPGELVRVRLHDRQQRFARGMVTAVLRAAPERIASPCPHEATCGAADWRWISAPAQQQWKQEILRDQLAHFGGLDLGDLTIGLTAAPETWGYRTTAQLHIAGAAIGYYAPHSRTVHDLPGCCLHHPLINAALAALRPLLGAAPALRGVTLRCAPSTATTLAILDPAPSYDELALRNLADAWRAAVPELVGVALGGRDAATLAGQAWLEHRIAGVALRAGAGAFFQVNAWTTPLLIDRVVALLDPQPADHLLDLFCGVGTFALPLARLARHVTAMETFAPAVADGHANAERNGLGNITWQAGAVETLLPALRGAVDGAVLDPPRRGCEPAVLARLVELRPARIVYVACHPGTLARDCRQLVHGGYRLTHAEVIDLFPHTHHVESIVRLER